MLQPALDAMVARRLDVPEQAAEGELPVVIERSARETPSPHSDRWRGKVESAHLAHEHGMKLPHLIGHRLLQLATLHSTLSFSQLLNGGMSGQSIERAGPRVRPPGA
jgi:hypothetical protein